MKNVLITGSNSSLGQTLMESAKRQDFQVAGIPGMFMNNKKSIQIKIEDTIQAFGSISHVVNNWGINHLSKIGETDEYDEQIYQQNVMGPYWVINELVRLRQCCKVINVASATYRVAQTNTALYCASKAALVQMTRVMARELAPAGWQINCVAPGKMSNTKMAVMTDVQVMKLRGWTEEEAENYALRNVPIGTFTSTDEVAEAIFKMFEMPPYVNGACLDIMGGV